MYGGLKIILASAVAAIVTANLIRCIQRFGSRPMGNKLKAVTGLIIDARAAAGLAVTNRRDRLDPIMIVRPQSSLPLFGTKATYVMACFYHVVERRAFRTLWEEILIPERGM